MLIVNKSEISRTIKMFNEKVENNSDNSIMMVNMAGKRLNLGLYL